MPTFFGDYPGLDSNLSLLKQWARQAGALFLCLVFLFAFGGSAFAQSIPIVIGWGTLGGRELNHGVTAGRVIAVNLFNPVYGIRRPDHRRFPPREIIGFGAGGLIGGMIVWWSNRYRQNKKTNKDS